MENYQLQPIPNGYRIVRSNGTNYVPVFEIYPPINEEIANQILCSIEAAYKRGYIDGWAECVCPQNN